MAWRIIWTGVALCLFVAGGRAQELQPIVPEPSAKEAQLPYANLSIAPAPTAQQPPAQQPKPPSPESSLVQAQYSQPTITEPIPPTLTYVPPDPTLPPPPACCEICGSSDPCGCDVAWCRSGWKLGLELYGLRSHLTNQAFGRWPDDGGGAARISLGYEWQSGFGIRASSWGYAEDASLPGPDVDLEMGTFNLDFYKAIVNGHNELIIGAGPAFGGLEFRVPAFNDRSDFRGGGASVFAEGYYPFYRQPWWEFAFVAATRLSLVAGDWRDNGGGIVDDTDGDSLTIWEIAFGLEFRHRCGRCGEHYWFVQAMPEYQQWSSEWLGEELDTSIALTGMNLNLGFAW